MTDSPSEEVSVREVARQLEAIPADLTALEIYLPAPLSLASVRRELTVTAEVCRRFADEPIVPDTGTNTDPATSDPETSGGDQ